MSKTALLCLMRKLKLIWDFRGPASQKTAEHHLIHLKEYTDANTIDVIKTGLESFGEMHHTAYIVVDESVMKPLRDALKPHRGQVFVG